MKQTPRCRNCLILSSPRIIRNQTNAVETSTPQYFGLGEIAPTYPWNRHPVRSLHRLLNYSFRSSDVSWTEMRLSVQCILRGML